MKRAGRREGRPERSAGGRRVWVESSGRRYWIACEGCQDVHPVRGATDPAGAQRDHARRCRLQN